MTILPPGADGPKWGADNPMLCIYVSVVLVLGDFNAIALAEEKCGGAPFDPNRAARFREVLEQSGLLDLGSTGPRFTWRGVARGGYDRVFERLDRAICNAEWRTLFGDTSADGTLITEEEALHAHATDHFRRLLSRERGPIQSTIPHCFPQLSPTALQSLVRPVTVEEVHRTLFDMGPFKAPGSDGYQVVFFQSNWEFIWPSLFEFIRQIMEGATSISRVNETLLILIPKIKRSETIHHFRPINLCNVSYKLVTKTIANRLQGYISELVSSNQVSFVPGHQIHDNIVVALELVHTMLCMRGRKKFMTIKVDLEKAYDRFLWDFIDDTLVAVGVPSQLRAIIMDCIPTMTCYSSPRHQRTKSERCVKFCTVSMRCPGKRLSSFNATSSLGRYLGVPVVHGRLPRDHFLHIINQVQVRLSGYAGKTLSLAGRVTLAKSVLQAMSSYIMHTMKLPALICSDLEKLCRSFVWGHSSNQRKIHLVNWQTVTQPLARGGLGLRDLSLFNDAILAKKGWSVITNQGSLWVRVVASKYMDRLDASLQLRVLAIDSWQWKGIA
ncbi:hypothetical protein CRG98_037935 [Punica granatum]|uniref:Reverse transcriptase domain-containing protein n=1 Tax=Punica granatum TaxID=22663 RepID=A0A2I0ICF9_PUNGR|nr:hypothetical protein CRG98_037935 [Punica granatum]